MRHTLRNVALASILTIGGLMALGGSQAQAQGFAGSPVAGMGLGGFTAFPTMQGGYNSAVGRTYSTSYHHHHRHHHRHYRGCGHRGW